MQLIPPCYGATSNSSDLLFGRRGPKAKLARKAQIEKRIEDFKENHGPKRLFSTHGLPTEAAKENKRHNDYYTAMGVNLIPKWHSFLIRKCHPMMAQ
jgi:hypothetical protein